MHLVNRGRQPPLEFATDKQHWYVSRILSSRAILGENGQGAIAHPLPPKFLAVKNFLH